jgi:subtilisin family serine protease
MHTRDPFKGVAFGLLSDTQGGPPELRVEVEALSIHDVRDLGRDPEVAAVAPVMPTSLVMPFEAPAGLAAEPAWGIGAVGADTCPFDGDGTVVAVLDTGIDATHPAFAGLTIHEQDFTGDGNGDVHGHGTHCAGTVFGRDVDGTRIGVARGVKTALIGKVLGNSGIGQSDAVFRGMQWALERGARVISISLGFDFPGLVKALVKNDGWPVDRATSVALEAYRANLRLFDALMGLVHARIALDGGAVVIAAAGNESRRDVSPQYEIAVSIPAAADGVIAVGALQKSESGLTVAHFSNTFPEVSAPGVGIVSAKAGGGLRVLSGTSMAAPHVAGVAALWWQSMQGAHTLVNARHVVAKLLATARTSGLSPNDDAADRGAGIVSAPVH